MMAATPEQKFSAAVKVIRDLPKNGSFQPSHELMLKFYAYFKQATEGPCTAVKPGIWNIVSRRKWEAWSALGQMERETAMLLYVEELKNVSKHVRDTLYPPEIVETMPQTEQVAEFVDTLGAFYELIEEDTKGLPTSASQENSSTDSHHSDHSATIGEMLKINNNDAKKGVGGDSDESTDTVKPATNGPTANCHDGTREKGVNGDDDTDIEEEEEEGKEEEEEEVEEENRLEDNPRADSGSDTDEFCDTSDQFTQLPLQFQNRQAVFASSASTPMDAKRETRVRFAPHIGTAGSPIADVEGRNVYNSYPLLHNFSSSAEQMLSDRLALGTPAGLPFLLQNSPLLPTRLSESLRVNDSLSSLTSLIGNDSVAGEVDIMEEEEEDTTLDADGCEGQKTAGAFDLVTSRGGGEEEASSQAARGSSRPAGHGGASSAARGGRDSGQGTSGGMRHGQLPPGSGGRGYRDGGEGRRRGGSLDEQILLALLRMRQDMTDISNRLAALEIRVQLQREEEAPKRSSKSSWWPFSGMSKTMVFLLFVWPVLAPVLINIVCRRRRSSPR